MEETLIPIPGFSGYFATLNGKVCAHTTGFRRWLKPYFNGGGFPVVRLRKDARLHHLPIHKILVKLGVKIVWPEYIPRADICRPVIQYDLKGNKIAEYRSIIAVEEAGYSASAVSRAALGHRKTAFGFRWEFVGQELRPFTGRFFRPVICLETRQVFLSSRELLDAGFDPSSVLKVTKRERKSHKGKTFRLIRAS